MDHSFRRYTETCRLINYLPLPRSVVSLHLPSTAILLYALLLDRATLSKKHGYSDALGWIYAVFPQEELCRTLHLSPTMVKAHLKRLESEGLIHRVRHSRKEANRYYLKLPADALTDTGTATFSSPEGRKTGLERGEKLPPIKHNKQTDIINSYQCREEDSL